MQIFDLVTLPSMIEQVPFHARIVLFKYSERYENAGRKRRNAASDKNAFLKTLILLMIEGKGLKVTFDVSVDCSSTIIFVTCADDVQFDF